MAQCVREDGRVRAPSTGARDASMDAAAVAAKFGVPPASIPDYLALVGDNADGYPGLPGWGARPRRPCCSATRTSRTSRTRSAPGTSACAARASLARDAQEHRAEALLYRELATAARSTRRSRSAIPRSCAGVAVDRPAFEAMAVRLRAPRLLERLPA